jgi:hypothetical protein
VPELRKYAAGDEIDSWCTKCKLMLNHRIVAMKGGTPAKVDCQTCKTTHMYRARPPGEKAEKAPKVQPGMSGSSRAPRATTAEKAMAAERERTRTWEKSIAGKAMSDFRSYRTTEHFADGELVRHGKFGDGVVLRIIDSNKIEVLFQDDSRILAHAPA